MHKPSRPRDEYIRTILKPSTWGGAIELAIFSKHFQTEIDSFDVLSGRADKFGEGQYDSRCVLVYSGIRKRHTYSLVFSETIHC